MKTTKEFKKDVYDKVGDTYKVISEYKGSNKNIDILHVECGNILRTKPSYFLHNNKRCEICNPRKRRTRTTKEVKELINEKFEGEFTLISEYKNIYNDLILVHNTENPHKFTISYTNLMKRGRCTKCNSKNINKGHDKFIQEVKNIYGNEYEILSKYIDNKTEIKIKHNKCGTEYYIRPVDLLHPNSNGKSYEKRSCPKCSKIISNAEIEVYQFIKSIIKDDYNIILNNRDVLDGKELDIYIPELNLAFEYNGIYWHSENMLRDKNYHLNKSIKCKNKNIKLIHIFENEWLYKNSIVKDKIIDIMGYNNGKRIYGSKCKVKKINLDTSNHFLEKFHINGPDNSDIRLGLYYENILVSVMTFKKIINEKYELSRFINHSSFIIMDSFKILLEYFTKNYRYSKIITYIDLRYDNSEIYIDNNFIHLYNSKPRHWYIMNDNSLCDIKELQEDKSLLENKYNKIWDCGYKVLEYK